MKSLGAALLAVAICLAGVAIVMDTSVGGYHNLSLASRQQNLLILAGAAGVIGAILLASGNSSTVLEAPAAERACPFCAERIKR